MKRDKDEMFHIAIYNQTSVIACSLHICSSPLLRFGTPKALEMGKCKCGRRRFIWSPARRQSNSPTDSPAMQQSSEDMDLDGVMEEDPLKIPKVEHCFRPRSPSVILLDVRLRNQEMSGTLGKLSDAVDKLGDKFDGLSNKLGDKFDDLSNKLTNVLENHGQRILNVEQGIQQVMQRVEALELRDNYVNVNVRPGRVICCYCNKEYSKRYLNQHKRRMHTVELLIDPQ